MIIDPNDIEQALAEALDQARRNYDAAMELNRQLAAKAAVGRAVLDYEALARSEWDQSDDALMAEELDHLGSKMEAAIVAALGDDDDH